MRLKHIVLGAALASLVGGFRPGFAGCRADTLHTAVHLPHRSVRQFRHPDRQRHARLSDHAERARRRHRRLKIVIEECETGYKNEKGVECYESLKSKNPAVITPYSTGITLALIPKAAVDHIPVLSMAYGLSASAVGNDFPWIFNPPATYWDGLSIILRYIGGKEGGLDKLKGKTIGYIYFDGGYGLEPIPLLDQLAKDYGFNVKKYPVPPAQMQNQSACGSASAATGPTT